jgi:hypothetical protein
MIESLSYCEVAEDFETKHSMLCSKYVNEILMPLKAEGSVLPVLVKTLGSLYHVFFTVISDEVLF